MTNDHAERKGMITRCPHCGEIIDTARLTLDLRIDVAIGRCPFCGKCVLEIPLTNLDNKLVT